MSQQQNLFDNLNSPFPKQTSESDESGAPPDWKEQLVEGLKAYNKRFSNYSRETSLPCYREVTASGLAGEQEQKVLNAIKGGSQTLLEISEKTSILQSLVSARASGLIKKGLAKYSGTITYKGRLRKKIIVT